MLRYISVTFNTHQYPDIAPQFVRRNSWRYTEGRSRSKDYVKGYFCSQKGLGKGDSARGGGRYSGVRLYNGICVTFLYLGPTAVVYSVSHNSLRVT